LFRIGDSFFEVEVFDELVEKSASFFVLRTNAANIIFTGEKIKKAGINGK
jgi:hypothetical protein